MESSLCKLILEATPYHLCLTLSARIESLGPAHTQEKGITQGREYQEVGITDHWGITWQLED